MLLSTINKRPPTICMTATDTEIENTLFFLDENENVQFTDVGYAELEPFFKRKGIRLDAIKTNVDLLNAFNVGGSELHQLILNHIVKTALPNRSLEVQDALINYLTTEDRSHKRALNKLIIATDSSPLKLVANNTSS